jgi:hypothetical protein
MSNPISFPTRLPMGQQYIKTGLKGFTPMLNPNQASELGVVKLSDPYYKRLEPPYFGVKPDHDEYWRKMEDWYLQEFVKETQIHSYMIKEAWFSWYFNIYHDERLRVESPYNTLMIEWWRRSLLCISEIPLERLEVPARVKQMYLDLCWNFEYPLNFKK